MAYSPASTLYSSLSHVAVTYYARRALDRIQKKFLFMDVCEPDLIPKQNGKTVQWFRFSNFAANTTAKSEGTVGTGITPSSSVITATVSQYADFATVSDFLKDVAIDEIVENTADLLSYRAGLSVDTITRTEIDGTSGSTNLALLGNRYSASDARNARHTLQGTDVLPFEDGWFRAIIHPYVSFDLMNDPAAGGLVDILKRNDSSALIKQQERNVIAEIGSVRFYESSNVKQTTGSPNQWRVYVHGKGGVGRVALPGRGPTKVTDPSKQRFKINIIQGQPSIADPEGVIGAAVSYNILYVAKTLDTSTYRFRVTDCPSSIVA